MNLKYLTDDQLTLDLKKLVAEERALLTQVLYHLKEVNRRKLYSSYGFTSLFDYACKELKYSADQAYRRIQAMKLLDSVPEVAKKIDSGELSLSNINQAQRYFNDNKVITKVDKITVLKKLTNKSVREGQKELLKLAICNIKTTSNEGYSLNNRTDRIEIPLPTETKKQITPTHMQVNFNMSENLEKKLEEVKGLLGAKAYNMSFSDLINEMVNLSIIKLKEIKFGKRNVKLKSQDNEPSFHEKNNIMNVHNYPKNLPKKIHTQGKISRYIPKQLKYKIWQRDNGECVNCRSKYNLNYDHIKPYALDGESSLENLRLLCFNCNQRHAVSMKLK